MVNGHTVRESEGLSDGPSASSLELPNKVLPLLARGASEKLPRLNNSSGMGWVVRHCAHSGGLTLLLTEYRT